MRLVILMKNSNLKLIIAALAGVVTMLLGFGIYRWLHPRTQVPAEFFSQLENMPTTTFEKPQFTGEKLQTPSHLPVLTTSVSSLEDWQARLDAYCQVYQASDFVREGKICDYYPSNESTTLVVMRGIESFGSVPTDAATAEQSARTLLATIYGDDITPLVVSSSYFPTETPQSEVTESEDESYQDVDETFFTLADDEFDDYLTTLDESVVSEDESDPEATMYFSQSYQDIPISRKDHSQKTIIVTVGPEYKIANATLWNPVIKVASTSKKYPLISIEEALDDIAAGNAYVSYYNMLEENTSYSQLTNINFDNVTLEYRLNDEQTQAIPCYHFSGMATDANGDPVAAEIITPAIRFTATP